MLASASMKRFPLLCIIMVVITSGCSKKTEVPKVNSSQGVLAVSTLLTTIAADEMPVSADPMAKYAPESGKQPANNKPAPQFAVAFHKAGRGVVYSARVGEKVHVVLNGKPGKFYKEVFDVTLSPDGQRVAYAAKDSDRYFLVVDNKEYGLFNETGPPVFSPDSKHIAFECKIGPQWYINVDGLKSAATASTYFDVPYFSSDSRYVLFYENGTEEGTQRIGISDLQFKKTVYKAVNGTLVFSNDKSRVAIVQMVGKKQKLVEFSFSNPEQIKESRLYDSIATRKFSDDGSVFAFVAQKDGKNIIVLDGQEEALPAGEYPWPFAVRPDNKGVGIFSTNNDQNRSYLHQAFFNNGIKSSIYKEGSELTYSKDGKHYAFVAVKNEQFLMVLDGKDGPVFDRVITPAFSPDGRFLVYRARQDGKRFVVVVDTMSGNITQKHTPYEHVFIPTFTDDGKSVAYAVQEGKQIMWKVEKL